VTCEISYGTFFNFLTIYMCFFVENHIR